MTAQSDYRRTLSGRNDTGIVWGNDGLPPIGWPVMIWKADLLKRAPGWNLRSGSYDEPQIMADQLKSGFIHTSVFVRAYRSFNVMRPDIMPQETTVPGEIAYYVDANIFPSRKVAIHSEIWEISYNKETGEILRPIVRLERYTVNNAIMFREGTKIQYWKLVTEKQEI